MGVLDDAERRPGAARHPGRRGVCPPPGTHPPRHPGRHGRRRGRRALRRASSAPTCRLVAVSERMVAITQGRSYPIKDIRPGRLARLLERFVTRPGYGIGLGSAETMELAIRRGRRAAHPVRSGRIGRHQAVRHPWRLLPPGRAPGQGHRRPDELHHPALQPGCHAGAERPRCRRPGHRRRTRCSDRDHRRQRCRLRGAGRQPRRRPPLRRAPLRRQPAWPGA